MATVWGSCQRCCHREAESRSNLHKVYRLKPGFPRSLHSLAMTPCEQLRRYKPQIVVTVLAEGSGEGPNIATPATKKVLETWFGK